MFENLTRALENDPKRDPMPTMGFLDHLEELRTSPGLLHRSRGRGLFRLLVEGRNASTTSCSAPS